MSVKCTKAPERGKMPSKAQLALLKSIGDGFVYQQQLPPWDWYTLNDFIVREKILGRTLNSCIRAGFLSRTLFHRYRISILGREVLKQMEGK